jgi:hypothetical protein
MTWRSFFDQVDAVHFRDIFFGWVFDHLNALLRILGLDEW